MAYTKEQIDALNKINTNFQTKYWTNAQKEFQNYVTTKYWANKYEEIKSNLKWTIENTPVNNKIQTPEEVKAQWVNVLSAEELKAKNLWTTNTWTTNNSNTTTSTTWWTIPPSNEWSYTTWTEPTNTWPKTDVSWVTTTQQAQDTTTSTIKENIWATTQQAEDFTNAQNVRTQEDKVRAEEKVKLEEDYAKKQQDLLKITDDKVKALEDQIRWLIDERKNRDIATMEDKKQSELDNLKADQDLQKWKDDQSIKKAEKDIDVSNMKANWAFNKMGVWFSSYAVNTTNRIATEWAEKIAWLKLQASANQAIFAKDIANIEFNYTKEINSTIDKYTDEAIKLDNQAIERVYNLQNNLLLSEKEKKDEINKITDEYLKNKRDNEDKIYAEMERLRDKQSEQVKALEEQIKSVENTNKTKINDLMSSWVWNTLSSIQKDEYLKKANITEAEAQQSLKSSIYKSAYDLIQWTLWKNYLPSTAQMDWIINEVNRMTLAWRTLEEAINIATNRVIKETPEYKASIAKKSWSGSWKISTSAMKQWDDWNWYAWDWSKWINTWLKWKTTTTKQNEYQLEDWTIVRDDWTWVVTPIKIQTGSRIEIVPEEEWVIWPRLRPEEVPIYENLKANKIWTNKDEEATWTIPSFDAI